MEHYSISSIPSTFAALESGTSVYKFQTYLKKFTLLSCQFVNKFGCVWKNVGLNVTHVFFQSTSIVTSPFVALECLSCVLSHETESTFCCDKVTKQRRLLLFRSRISPLPLILHVSSSVLKSHLSLGCVKVTSYLTPSSAICKM
ncbi:hypothetical protein E2542_SST31199 [Spatholobus suberectus]|nr:hypothetical protein E2542_SST31199 [Spatholobus suberectus]